MDSINILYLNSFSRSGETLMLRLLNAHKDIKVLHQLFKLEDEGDELYELFKLIKKDKPNKLSNTNPLINKIEMGSANNLFVKNSIFENNNPHKGFILIRNPFSIYLSYLKMSKFADFRKQMNNWANNIDQRLIDIVKLDDFLLAFCSLYNRKMGKLFFSGLPVIHYENFVNDAEKTLKPVFEQIEIEWDANILNSHLLYEPGDKGHGNINLSSPISNKSVHSYSEMDDGTFRKIYGMCYPVLEMYGYTIDKNRKVLIK